MIELYPKKETAKMLHISIRTLEKLMARRKIAYIKIGKKVFFLPDHIQTFLQRNTFKSRPF